MRSRKADVPKLAVWNLLLRARGGGSTAPSPDPMGGSARGPVPLAPSAARDPAPGGGRAEGAGEAEVPRRD